MEKEKNYKYIHEYMYVRILMHMYLHIFHSPPKGDKFDAMCLLVL